MTVNYFLFFATPTTEIGPPSLQERLNQVSPEAVLPNSSPSPATAPGNSFGPANAPLPSAPDLKATPEERDDFGEPIGRKVAGKLKRGQTVMSCLNKEGIDSRTALPVIRAMEDVFDFRQAQVGNTFEAVLDDEGQVRHFVYTQSLLDIYQVDRRDDGSYEARKKAVPTRIEISKVGCAVKSSLYESVARCGEGSQLAAAMIDLFAWDVDFYSDLRKGDEFRISVEKISVDGRFLRYGKVLALEYNGKFGRKRIVHYTDPEGNQGHYSADGRSLKKDFLKSPLKYTRVSAGAQSGIRGSLKKAGPVVYVAKEGTPVWAVASGTVVFAGKSGKLGNAVTIRHANGFTSTYGHLGKTSRHLKVGRLVTQKTVLGHVGQSGKATEPQLLFSLRKKGKAVNALRMSITDAEPVPAEHRAHFEREVRELIEELESIPVVGVLEQRS